MLPSVMEAAEGDNMASPVVPGPDYTIGDYLASPVVPGRDYTISDNQSQRSHSHTLDWAERAEKPAAKPPSHFRRTILGMSPVWFSVPMGTGVMGLLLMSIPWTANWLYWLAVITLAVNTVLFFGILLLWVLQALLQPRVCVQAILHWPSFLFLGTIPIAFATIIELWLTLCTPHWGYWAVTFAWAMWMIDFAAAATITVGSAIYTIGRRQAFLLENFNTTFVLPIAASIVAASTGASCALHLHNANHAFGTILASYALWSLAVPLAMIILVIYYHRLLIHKFPASAVVVSSFAPLGPLGMGGYTILLLGRASYEVLPKVSVFSQVQVAASFVYIASILTAIEMWGFGLIWFCLALAACWHARPMAFNMSWWSFVFPIGVFALSTMTIGVELPSLFFRVFGTMLSVCTILLWLTVSVLTASLLRKKAKV